MSEKFYIYCRYSLKISRGSLSTVESTIIKLKLYDTVKIAAPITVVQHIQ